MRMGWEAKWWIVLDCSGSLFHFRIPYGKRAKRDVLSALGLYVPQKTVVKGE